MASDASHMLEAALEQMDDIIAGSKAAAEYTNGLFELGSPGSAGPLQVLQLVEDLRLALELQPREEERDTLRAQVPSGTAHMLMDWLDIDRCSERVSVNLCSPVNNESYQERLVRLEGDKESLVLQVSVLTDQVEAQGEKIRDLETSLEEHYHKLNSTEEMLQQELLSRTSLETQKLDLMDEVSYLKLKLVDMDEEQNHNDNSEDQQNKAEGFLQELRFLKSKVDELEGEKSQYEKKLKATKSLLSKLSSLKLTVEHTQVEKQHWEERWRTAQAEIADLQQMLASKDSAIEGLQSQLVSRGPMTNENPERVEEVYRRQLTDKYQELQRLKMGMESLVATNNEKDRHIEELTVLLGQYRKMKEVMALTQVSSEKLLVGSSEEELSGSLKMRAITHKAHSHIIRSAMSSRGSSPLLVSPSSFQKELDSSCRSIQTSLKTSMVMVSQSDAGCYYNGEWSQPRMLSSSLEELQSGSLPKHVVVGQPVEPVSENQHMEMNKYQTLPGKLSRPDMNGDREQYSTPDQLSPDDSEDSEFHLNRCRSASAPALGSCGKHDLFDMGKSERLDESTLSDLSPLSSGVDSGQQSPVSPENKKNHRGIKKLWGKIRKTQSGSLQGEDLEPGEFKRGGLRATAGPRLARAGETLTSVRDLKTPFSKWTPEQVCCWLEEYGLGQYVILARHWADSGQTLLSASPQDLEKEMGIKNPLHRKKLQLALKSFSTKLTEKSSELDHIWVTRWLDDIGLPQYKDQFHQGRVDGRMLQYLTVNNLLFLKVTSQLHHLSVKCAIHVLHVNKFNPNCLKRRPGDENKTSPSEVVQWSNHRVMEWLRSVDLAEYAPNLRGSGVHGGLIILEPRFNSDTLAMLLNIPPQKTLLRRHLATNFNMLVGSQAQQEKREFMESSGYTPLSTTAKVRPKKLGFSNFGHLRKKRCDDSTDYICPLEAAQAQAQLQAVVNGAHRPYSGFRGLSPILDRDPDRREQMAVTEGTVLQIEALSEGINQLTGFREERGAGAVPNIKGRPILVIRETTL
ncbi:liprin-beta-2-like isoform X9 [Salvelinus fontinalis]|uniref:liprin-beta-2-like isoform X9 n=1 Tax=Salvelinus fontinalis TaxID=8038 RepID=UPI002484FA98|nr:liprin-beta-2-like isoform X9 [Salvelinus fontinalis]